MALKAPTPEKLFDLLMLCANNETQVIRLLARQYELPPDAIAPTVKNWLAELPSAPPPSRQRSAPPQLAGPSAMPFPRVPDPRMPPTVLPIKPPPASAPTQSAAKDVMAAMRAIDSRLNSSTRADDPRGPKHSSNRLALVPEHAPFQPLRGGLKGDDVDPARSDDDIAKAYVQMQQLVHGRGRLEPAKGGAHNAVASTWMTRAVHHKF